MSGRINTACAHTSFGLTAFCTVTIKFAPGTYIYRSKELHILIWRWVTFNWPGRRWHRLRTGRKTVNLSGTIVRSNVAQTAHSPPFTHKKRKEKCSYQDIMPLSALVLPPPSPPELPTTKRSLVLVNKTERTKLFSVPQLSWNAEHAQSCPCQNLRAGSLARNSNLRQRWAKRETD